MDGAEVVLRLFWLGIGLLERNNDFDGVVAPPDPSGALRRRREVAGGPSESFAVFRDFLAARVRKWRADAVKSLMLKFCVTAAERREIERNGFRRWIP